MHGRIALMRWLQRVGGPRRIVAGAVEVLVDGALDDTSLIDHPGFTKASLFIRSVIIIVAASRWLRGTVSRTSPR